MAEKPREIEVMITTPKKRGVVCNGMRLMSGQKALLPFEEARVVIGYGKGVSLHKVWNTEAVLKNRV